MSSLLAMVRATRASAKALSLFATLQRSAADADREALQMDRTGQGTRAVALRGLAAAHRRSAARAVAAYERAQAVLLVNPLPGD